MGFPRSRGCTVRLDGKTVAGLKLSAGKDDHLEWDDDLTGFGVRLRSSGRKVWIVQYRPPGTRRTRRVTLGTIEKLTPAQARDAARKILARAALGHDPQGEKAARRQREARTFRSVVDAYLAARASELRPESARIAKLYLTGSYFRPLHPIGVSEIAHPDIAARLSAITRAHSANTAAAARRAVSALFRWAMEEGWTTVNPVIGTLKPTRAASRDRVLTDAELVAVWKACGDDDHGRIVRLLILLPSRRGEIGGMRWSEIDLHAGTWTLPAARSKNHRAYTIAL